jgi:hypothetical protein
LGDGYELRFSTAPIVTAGDFAAATLVLPRPLLRPSGQAVTGVVAGLAPGTLYYVAVRSTDALGRASAPSNVVSATTAASDLIAPATPVLSSAPVYDTSLVLAWTAPGDDGNVGTAAAYDLRMSSAPINAGNFAAATPIATAAPKAAGGAERVVVAGLAPGTTYHFALQVADEVPRLSGLATDSDTTAASDTTAPSRVTDLAASAAISDGFTLTWTAPGDDAAIGSATLYDIRIAATTIATTPAFLAAAPLAGAPAPQPAGTLQTLVVTGLAPATTYHLALRAADEVPNAGAVSNAVSITTAPPPSGGGASAGSGGGGGGCGLGGLAAALLALSLLRWRRLH